MGESHAGRIFRLVAAAAVGLALVLVTCGGPGPASAARGGPQSSATAIYAGISASTPTGSAAISPEGLVVAFDMETTTADGRLRDFSGNGHHGAFAIVSRVDGAHGGARLYREVAHRVHLQEDPAFDLDGPLTIAAWVRVDEGGLHQHIFACDDKFALWVTPDDRFRLGDTRGGGWSTIPGSVRPGRWTSVVAVLRGTKDDPLTPETVALWVDGELADAALHQRTAVAEELGTWNPGDLYPADACYIGFESHQGMESHKTMPFVGAVDELLLFNRALGDAEVAAFAGVAAAPTVLVR